ncbi:MAG: GNAT family N-acetyltransferase [Ruminococcaceae bacterium]|nr:GNAT family N-acetyltransferase [Oscillospiraceae bacterium]
MTVFVFCMNELNTEQLLAVYRDENQTKGRIFYPDASPFEQLMQVEEDFLSYLREDFFCQKDAFYALLDDGKSYCSAVRLEPYKDGMLLEGIATIHDKRRQGYAAQLLTDVLTFLRTTRYARVYAHVAKNNIASMKLHKKCGFQEISDFAAFIDGSVSHQSCTLCYYL